MTDFHLVRLLFFLFVAVACDGPSDAVPPGTPTDRPLLTVAQGDIRASVRVEIASTPSQREQGLMFRQELAEDAGMLFLFPANLTGGFWMKNTYVPLDIAYIDEQGTVLEVRPGKPLDETPIVPQKPYRYTLEVNQGWFERHGLGPGATVTLPAGLPQPQ